MDYFNEGYFFSALKLYTHVFTWPANGLLKIPSLTNTINKVYLLKDTTTSLNFKDSTGYLRISVPVNAPNSINSVVVIDVTGVPAASTQYTKATGITVSSAGGIRSIPANGGTLQMSVSLLPANASDKTVTWAVSDTALASISNAGLITAKKNGELTVTATANDGSDIQGKLTISISDKNSYTEVVSLTNPGFEFPNDNSKIKCTQNGVSLNQIDGFGWKLDKCGDSGREDPTKAGLPTSSTPAFEGTHVGYLYNYDPHMYQVVEVINQAGVTYSLTGQVNYSYSGGDIAFTGVYISLFSGTDATKRTIVKGDSVQYTVGAAGNSGWKQVVVNYTTTSADIGKQLCIETGSSVKNGGIYWSYVDAFTLTKTTTTSGTNIISEDQFEIYPNPSENGLFNLKSAGNGSVSVYNSDGKLVCFEKIFNRKQGINLSSQSKGLYLVKVQTNDGEYTRKVILD